MTKQQAWKDAYGRQRLYRGKAVYVARDPDIAEALRRVMPPGRRIVNTHLSSGRPASYAILLPPL
jgi:hypothetical protein